MISAQPVDAAVPKGVKFFLSAGDFMNRSSLLLDLAVDMGYELAMSGAETFRVEESINRMLRAYGLQAEVFALPTWLNVCIQDEDGQPLTKMRRIGHHGNDLDMVEKLNGLCRTICSQTPRAEEGQLWLRQLLERRLTYTSAAQYLAGFLSAAGFCLFFGGDLADSLCSGLCGALVCFVNQQLDARKANHFFRTIASSFLMAMLAYALGLLGFGHNCDAITIGSLMLLVPGLLFTNAMRDIIYGDTLSGTNRIVQVFLVAAAIALGTAWGWRLSVILWGDPPQAASVTYPVYAQCLFVFASCIGFCVLFNVHGPGGLLCALGGALSWAVYCAAMELGFSEVLSYFWAGLFSSVYSELMARIRKYPAISYLVVSIFPLIPGAGVYFAMNYAMQGKTDLFASQGLHTAAIAGSIAVGILLGSTVFRMYSDWRLHHRP